MGTKASPGVYDCWETAEDDEPVFVLLGRDASAPGAVRNWARRRFESVIAGHRPKTDLAKIIEALECADQMRAWRIARPEARLEAELKAAAAA